MENTKNTAEELVIFAEEEAFNLPDERFEELQEELKDSPWLSEVEEREELIDALAHITVSPEVRAICEAEMELGRKSGWRLR